MNVSDLQWKLSTWAEQDEERKFHGLYKLITDADWINFQMLCTADHREKTKLDNRC